MMVNRLQKVASSGGSSIPRQGMLQKRGINLLIGQFFFLNNCMKMKEIGRRRGHTSLVPLASANGHYCQMTIHEEHDADFEIGNQDFAANRFLEKLITPDSQLKTNLILNKFASMILVTQFSDEFFTISSQYKIANVANFILAVPF